MRCAEIPHLQASILLRQIRDKQDASMFGYLIQGLFAHALIRLGGIILGVEAQGHPDIICRIFGVKWRLEVSVVSTPYTIDPADLTAIRSIGETDLGFLGILDYDFPIRWLLLPYQNVDKLGGRRVYPAELEARADESLSKQLTETFCALVIDNKERLTNLDFRLLRDWALTGQVI